MIVIVYAHDQPSAGIEVKKPFHGLDVLNRVMVQLAAQLKKQKRSSNTPGQQKQPRQDDNVPESQAGRTWRTRKMRPIDLLISSSL